MSSGLSCAAPAFPPRRRLWAVRCEIHLPHLTLLKHRRKHSSMLTHNVTAQTLSWWLLLGPNLMSAIWRKSAFSQSGFQQQGCRVRNAISCNCLLIFSEYLSIPEIIKFMWIATINPHTGLYVSLIQAIILDETLMISLGKLGCSRSNE